MQTFCCLRMVKNEQTERTHFLFWLYNWIQFVYLWNYVCEINNKSWWQVMLSLNNYFKCLTKWSNPSAAFLLYVNSSSSVKLFNIEQIERRKVMLSDARYVRTPRSHVCSNNYNYILKKPLLREKHCVKCFIYTILFSSHSGSIRW